MKNIVHIITLCLTIFASNMLGTKIHVTPEWNMLIYMDGMDELHAAGFKNISDAMAGFNGTNAHVCIQVHADSETNIAYRYHLTPGKLVFDDVITLTPDPVQNIIDGAHWAFTENSAQYNGLVLWNHGAGILDPTWQSLGTYEKFGWLSEPDGVITRYMKHTNHRGILLDNVAKTYVNNEQLIQALTGIKNQILGKKLDIIGTDTCGMAMLEVAWQVRNYAHYFIGAQNCALKDGWPYQTIMAQISTISHAPVQAAHMITTAYDEYYKKLDVGGYTQLAIDLSKIESIKNNFDAITQQLLSTYTIEQLKTVAYTARQRCPVFCIHPTYTDLWTWYDELAKELPNTSQIIPVLQIGKKLIEQAVVGRAVGPLMQQAHGMSIYFPYHHVDSSYLTTQFAHDAGWSTLLTRITAD